MKNIFLLLSLLFAITQITNAQQSELVGIWQLSKVMVDGEIHDDLKAIYIFEEGGLLKAARSTKTEIIEAGSWKFKKGKNKIIMSSTLDKDFSGEAILTKISESELVYEKDDAILFFKRISNSDLKPANNSTSAANIIPRLNFTEADFFGKDDEYKYYNDEEKLPWQDIDKMMINLAIVKQLVYKYSKLDESTNTFNDDILVAEVNSNHAEQTLSIDYIFHGYDRYSLPEDVELQANNEYSNLLYPEEENTFRVSGSEQIKTSAGTFDCTVVEVVGRFETRKKLWMINNKPGIFAKIITDKPGDFGQYSVFELQEIKMKRLDLP